MSIFVDAREKGKVKEGKGKREGGRGGEQCNGLKSQNNHSHLFAHYEWFAVPKERTRCERVRTSAPVYLKYDYHSLFTSPKTQYILKELILEDLLFEQFFPTKPGTHVQL